MARPRIYPPGEERPNRDYVRASRKRLEERGGRIVQLRLEPEEAEALAALKKAIGVEEDRAAIVAAITTLLSRKPPA